MNVRSLSNRLFGSSQLLYCILRQVEPSLATASGWIYTLFDQIKEQLYDPHHCIID